MLFKKNKMSQWKWKIQGQYLGWGKTGNLFEDLTLHWDPKDNSGTEGEGQGHTDKGLKSRIYQNFFTLNKKDE